ncbi:relaxase, partial [Lentilactobacillus parabuchneri]|nr:relaxase [Lentilactobacillus parabuchneri]
RGKRLGADYDKEAILSELERRNSEQEQQLDREDQSRATELVRDTKQADTALNQRERATESRKPTVEYREQGIDRLTSASCAVRRKQQEINDRGSHAEQICQRIRPAVRTIAEGLQRFTDGLQRFTKQVSRFIDDRLTLLKRLTAMNERHDQQVKEQKLKELTKLNEPKPTQQPTQHRQNYGYDRGGPSL